MKICSKPDCVHGGRPQPLANFHKDKQKKSGYRPDCKTCQNLRVNAYAMERKEADPEDWKLRRKRATTKWRYGITLEELNERLAATDWRCEICQEKFEDQHDVNVDHCHNSDKVRGLLCRSCNWGLGQFKDNPHLLTQAIRYLER